MPIDRGLLDLQLQGMGESSRWWDRRELRDLPTALHADERILAISRGKVARPRWVRPSWLIVVTDQRLLCLRSGARAWRQIEVPGGQITRVALRIGLFRGRVLVMTSGDKYGLLVPRADAYKLLAALSGLVKPGKEVVTGFGPTLIARRVIDHVLALPAVALDPTVQPEPVPAPFNTSAIEERIQSLEEQIHQLKRQVDFLEELLRQRHSESIASITS